MYIYIYIYIYIYPYIYTHIYPYIYILIGWQAYRGDQIHRKNSPTEPRNQIQVVYKTPLINKM